MGMLNIITLANDILKTNIFFNTILFRYIYRWTFKHSGITKAHFHHYNYANSVLIRLQYCIP